MSITLNLLAWLLPRRMTRGHSSSGVTLPAPGNALRRVAERWYRRPGAAPPLLRIETLNAHLRRDIGLDN